MAGVPDQHLPNGTVPGVGAASIVLADSPDVIDSLGRPGLLTTRAGEAVGTVVMPSVRSDVLVQRLDAVPGALTGDVPPAVVSWLDDSAFSAPTGSSVVVLSLLAVVSRRFNVGAGRLLLGVVLLTVTCALVMSIRLHDEYYSVFWRTDCRATSIIVGALGALLASRGYGSKTAYLNMSAARWCAILAVLGIFMQNSLVPNILKYTVGSLLLGMAVTLVAQHGKSGFWRFTPLVWLGTISYSVYLWQQPIYYAVHRHGLHPIVGFAAAIAAGRPRNAA
jgi:hypothetical protein